MDERSRYWDVAIVLLCGLALVFSLLALVGQNRTYDHVVKVGKAVTDLQASAVRQNDLNALRGGLDAVVEAINERPAAAGGAPAVTAVDERHEWERRYRDPNARDGGTLYLNMGSEPGTLNPLTAKDAYASAVYGRVAESFAIRDFKNPSKWIPELATSWEASADHLEYTFTLREGVKWDDGEPFTVDDIIFSFETMRLKGVDCENLVNYYKDLDRIEKVGANKVRFVWNEPYFLSFEFSAGFTVLPKHLYEFDRGDPMKFNNMRSDEAHGTGPYRLVEWKRGQHMILKRNPHYWGEPAHFETIVYRFILDPPTELLMLRRGELDVIGPTQDQWVEEAETNNDEFKEKFVRYPPYTTLGYNYIGWQNQSVFFEDKRVRRAMTHLVNRPYILRTVLRDLAEITTGNFWVNSPSYDKSIEPWPFDPALAGRLLDEAGWRDTDGDGIRDKVIDGQKRQFAFKVIFGAGRPNTVRMLSMVADDMRRAGVVMELAPMKWDALIPQIDNKKFDACSLGWALGYEGDPYQLWHSSQAKVEHGSNMVGFVNEEADLLIEKARREFDLQKRTVMYHRFHAILHEEQPYTFLFSGQVLTAYSRRLQNVSFYQVGGSTQRFWWAQQ